MFDQFEQQVSRTLEEIRSQGLYKTERIITSPQDAKIEIAGGKRVLNMCANNYLGLADHPALIAAAKQALDTHGFGMASVRFICGTQDIHKQLEASLTKFLGTEDTILYPSCFDANGGLFETLLADEDAVISDELNHASIIDGVRLCKAKRLRYKHADLADLERALKEAEGCRLKLIATDSVFSMDGDLAPLPGLCDLAERHRATVMIDESHGTGHLGPTGRGAAEQLGVLNRIDIITSTLGKTLGGAVGGFTTGAQEVVDFLRQRSRPYLFSNSLTPSIAAAAKKALELVAGTNELRDRLRANTQRLRSALEGAGFVLKPGQSPISPVMIGDAALAAQMADKLLERGIYVIGFSYPVVPQGQARIRLQMSAAHTPEQIDRAVAAFTVVGKELGVLGK